MYTFIKGPFSVAYNRQHTNRSAGFKNPLRGLAYVGGLIALTLTEFLTTLNGTSAIPTLVCVAGGQAVKDRAGERPPARFGFVFQVPPTSLYFVISQLTNTKYIFNTSTENYFTLDNTVINSSCNLI